MEKTTKIRKVFLDNLPYKNNKIDWKKCNNYIVEFIYDDIKGKIKIISYENTTQLLLIEYKNTSYKIKTCNFVRCKIGNKLLKKKTFEFKLEIGTRFKDDKRDITIIDREHRDKKKNNGSMVYEKWYKYICNTCGWEEGWMIEGALIGKQKTGCSCCTNRTTVLGINSIYDTDKWMIPYIGEECAKTHTHGSQDKIHPICPECGKIRNKLILIKSLYRLRSISCPCCGDGILYPNKFSYELLNQLNISFETEYSPKWLSPKRYDFYFELNNKKYVLEMDGGLGHGNKDNDMSGMTKEESKGIDDDKDKLALEHGIEVIRIDCNYENNDRFEYIKQNIIINNKLNELFDLSNIDWIKIDLFSVTSRMYEVCDHWNNKLAIDKIMTITKLSRSTVVKYLNKGKKLNKCTYDSSKEIIKNMF